MFRSLARRLDALWLRWSGRLDTPALDRSLPWLVGIGLTIVLAALALARERSLEAGTALAEWTQVTWLVSRFDVPEASLLGGHALAQQAAFIILPVGLLTEILPVANTLLVLQALALGLGAVPVWRIARDVAHLRMAPSAVLLGAYALYPAIHGLNLADFHPEALAVPFLLGAARYGLTERWVWFVVFAGIAVACRADLALAIAGLGIVIAGRQRRAGITIVVVSIVGLALSLVVIQPAFADGSYPHVEAFARFGDTPWSIAFGMLRRPDRVITAFITEDNFRTLVFLLAPVLFLPLLAPRQFLPVLPVLGLYFIADVPAGPTGAPQQLVAAIPFVFLAAAAALTGTGRPSMERVSVNPRILTTIALAAMIFFLQDSPCSPFREPWDWGGRDRADGARLIVVDRINPQDVVMAPPVIQPLVAEREGLYDLDPAVLNNPLPAGLTVVIHDRSDSRWSQEQLDLLEGQLDDAGFTIVSETGPVIAWFLLVA